MPVTKPKSKSQSTPQLVSEKDAIWIKDASMHNLKHVDLILPKRHLIAVTGLSGSGKSSLIMDTLYAEGQRRYVESLSSYARQFLARMKKPDVEFIKGLCPAIAIEQKVVSGNARSTVGSMTELYDLLRILYARIGHTYDPQSGQEVKRDQVSDVVDYVQKMKDGTKLFILSPLNLHYSDRTLGQEMDILTQKGYARILLDGEQMDIDDAKNVLGARDLNKKLITWKDRLYILIDRVVVNHQDEDNQNRIADSIQTAIAESDGGVIIQKPKGKPRLFTNRFEINGRLFLDPSPQLFNYNNPYGACPECEGYGMTIGIDRDKVIPDRNLSLYEGAVMCWRGESSSWYLDQLIQHAEQYDLSIHKPYRQLSKREQDLVWNGSEDFIGIYGFFEELEKAGYKIQNRVMIARYRGRSQCRSCGGMRLREEATWVKIADKHIGELIDLPLRDLLHHMSHLKLSNYEKRIAQRVLYEIDTRLKTLNRIGLGYLTLNRTSNTLSGGETQRINLSRLLGSNLTNSLYILDEPSIGLHPRDTEALVSVLLELRDLGNTVIVVEHEEAIISQVDYIVDMGPRAGTEGGQIIYAGAYHSFIESGHGLTAEYIQGKRSVTRNLLTSKATNRITLHGASHHNLQNIDVTIPLNRLTVVTGVSGSGKSTLIKDILYPELMRQLGQIPKKRPGTFERLSGDISVLSDVEYIGQKAIGTSSRSNPVTYIKAYDHIRNLFIEQHLSKVRGYKPKHFSFNVDGGRCEHCKGDGTITVEMQFLADIELTCDVCGGRRFRDEILDVKVDGKNIHDVLTMRVDDAIQFFKDHTQIVTALQPLVDVGLGYLQLSQSSNTLSGGEAQRLKIAYYLARERYDEHILFLFDEPTTGLHFHDTDRLLKALDMLITRGNTVVAIEHNMDFIRCADWIVDLGPGGGDEGGNLIYEGSLEGLRSSPSSITAKYI